MLGQGKAHGAAVFGGLGGEAGQGKVFTARGVVDLLILGRAVPVAVVVVQRALGPLRLFPALIVGAGELYAWCPPPPDRADADDGVVVLAGAGVAEGFDLRGWAGCLPGRLFVFARLRLGQVGRIESGQVQVGCRQFLG